MSVSIEGCASSDVEMSEGGGGGSDPSPLSGHEGRGREA